MEKLTTKQKEYYNYLESKQSEYRESLLIRFNNIRNKYQLLKIDNVDIETMTFNTTVIDGELNGRFINALANKNYFKDYIVNEQVIGVSL